MGDAVIHAYRAGAARRTRFGYVTEDHPGLDRIQNGISALCGVIAAVAVVAIVLITLSEAMSRTLFDVPFGWSVAFTEQYLLTAAAFFGIVTAYRSGAHVAVVSLFEQLAPAVRKALLLVSYVVMLACLGAMAWAGWESVLFSVEIDEAPVPGSSELGLPSWVWRSFVPLSMVLGMVVVLIDLARELMSPWTGPSTDYDPGDELAKIEESLDAEAQEGKS